MALIGMAQSPSQQWGSIPNEGVITVPEIILPFQENILERLETTINPLGPTTNHGIDLFEEAIATISGNISQNYCMVPIN